MGKGIEERPHEATSAYSKHRGIEVLEEGWAHGSGSIDSIAMDEGGAASIAEIAGARASYAESRGKSEGHCQALVADYLRKHGTASRLELNETVFPSLSSELTDSQKYDKVGNMLAKMRRSGTIVFDKRKSVWMLAQVLEGLREPTRYLRGHRLPDPALRNIRSTRPPSECPFNSR